MKAGLLVTGGECPPFAAIEPRLPEFSLICAADSGLDALRAWGVRPDIVVGDMDSLADASVLSEYGDVRVWPRDKDDTDTELGIRAVRERGCGRVVVAGGGGGRIDHLLAIRALFERPQGPDEWLTRSERLVRIGERTSFSVDEGSVVSVFPLSGGASGMASEGLRWPLDGLRWGPGDFGVSNVATAGTIVVEPGYGSLIVILRLRS